MIEILRLLSTGAALVGLKNAKEFDILEDEQEIKRGYASWVQKGFLKVDGHLCLTNKRLRFQGAGDEYLSYPLDEISSVEFTNYMIIVPLGLAFEFSDGRREVIAVNKREGWAAEILKAIAPFGGAEAVEKATDGTVLDSDRVALCKKITGYFSGSELNTLCFDLGIEYENLAGDTKESKSRELIVHCERNGQFSKLLKYCQGHRSHVKWL